MEAPRREPGSSKIGHALTYFPPVAEMPRYASAGTVFVSKYLTPNVGFSRLSLTGAEFKLSMPKWGGYRHVLFRHLAIGDWPSRGEQSGSWRIVHQRWRRDQLLAWVASGVQRQRNPNRRLFLDVVGWSKRARLGNGPWEE